MTAAKKAVVFVLCFLIVPSSAGAQKLYENDYANLGAVAGAALACDAGRPLKHYQGIVKNVIFNTATTKAERDKAVMTYTKAMKKAYDSQKTVPPLPCSTVLSRFERQPLLKATVYSDGSVKMPDGTVLKAPPSSYRYPPEDALP